MRILNKVVKWTVKLAKQYTGGGPTRVSKMPEYSYNLSAHDCNVGQKLVEIDNSVCSDCYALKGRYTAFAKTILPAQRRRLESLTNREWAPAMAYLIKHYDVEYFRWHASGDLQDLHHLIKIGLVAYNTPDTKHWLPTREYGIVRQYLSHVGQFPKNLSIRISAHFINKTAPNIGGLPITSVVEDHSVKNMNKLGMGSYHVCPAGQQGGQCDGVENGGVNCRQCWTNNIPVAYPIH